MENFRDIVYRPYPAGTIAAPMQIRSTGHYRVPQGWRDGVRVKPFLELFWSVAGIGEFRHADSVWQLNSGEVFLYLPDDCHRITALSETFDYYWFTVDGPWVPALIESFSIVRGPREAGLCPEQLFNRLAAEVRGIGRDAEFRAGAAAYEILSLAMNGAGSRNDSLVQRFKELVEHEYDDPNLSMNSICRRLAIHRSTLTRQVTRQCGIPPQEYLTGFRLQTALRILKNEPNTPIKEVAEAAGFNDPNYFTKVFTHRLGKSPSDLRRLL